ncbi:MAG: hypothetical protein U0R51_03955 [Solirubrobacterales bacterium]
MNPETMRQVAMERLRERARRIGLIRRSVIAGAVATFALAWGLALSDQLAHGTKTSPSDTSTTADTGTVSSSDDEESDDGFFIDSSPSTAPAPAPLTTSQS